MCIGSTLFTHIRIRTSRLALLYSVPTVVLGRLIALGGAEFLNTGHSSSLCALA